jgi:thymidylate synthase (FAD)
VNIHLIAEPHLNWQGILQWLEDLGALPWALKFCDTQPYTADGLAELAGRRCYLSFGTREDGLNPNVVKIREDQEAYIANILSSKHGSVLEHAQFTFALEGVSRVLTHELVRHRAGTAISQESGRYVRLTKDIPFELPDIFKGYPALKRKSERLLAAMGEFQEDVALTLRLDQDGTPFARKKEVTSAMRRYAPEGRSTGLVWSANVRALRHVIETRSAAGAEVESRDFAQQLGDIMVKKAPLLFGDFKVDEEGQWVPLNSKV